MCDMTQNESAEFESYVQWLVQTQLCVWRDSFICVTWLISMCDMTQNESAEFEIHVQ